MFYYEEKNGFYYIFSDKIKWKFWPFLWIFCKNKYLWKISENKELEKKYKWYKFSFWITKNKIFIIWKEGIFEVLEV